MFFNNSTIENKLENIMIYLESLSFEHIGIMKKAFLFNKVEYSVSENKWKIILYVGSSEESIKFIINKFIIYMCEYLQYKDNATKIIFVNAYLDVRDFDGNKRNI